MTSHSREPAVLGLDIGGTSSRAAVLHEGAVIASALGAGANPRSSAGDLCAELARILRAVIKDAGAVESTVCIAAVAGAGRAGEREARKLIQAAVREAGISSAPLHVVPDTLAAFASGAAAPDGALLLAGTGAIACRFRGFQQIARADGLGWLLGDAGGGVWLALEGLRAAAWALDGRIPSTSLTTPAVLMAREAGAETGDPRQDLVQLVDRRSPAELGAFAATVSEHAIRGDRAARDIVLRAAQALLTTLRCIDDGVQPVVLAGSVLTNPGPVRDVIQEELAGRSVIGQAPILGALILGARRAGVSPPRRNVYRAHEL